MKDYKITDAEAARVLIKNVNDRPNALSTYGEAKKTSTETKDLFDRQFELVRKRHNDLNDGVEKELDEVKEDIKELEEKIENFEAGILKETDPTVPNWAKNPTKPNYTADEVGALPASTKIPAKTSEITNDSGFITKAVGDLANYYLKSQTYTKDEVRALISSIPKFAIEVVTTLPASNISTTTIYLVGGGESGNLYTEYIYAGGKWEKLGTQTVDLTGYATEAWVNMQLGSYLKQTELDAAIHSAFAAAKESGAFDSVHVGTEAPTDGQAIWIDTDEEPENGGNSNSGNASSAQPDFAANEGEDGHILNRTHYVDKNGIIHKLDNKFIDADWMATSERHDGNVFYSAELDFAGKSMVSFKEYGGGFKIDPGIELDIYWNGVRYPCVAMARNDETYIGNGSLVYSDIENTNEPFCLYSVFLSPDLIYYVAKASAEADVANCIVALRSTEVYNKLPREFLTEGVVMKVNGKSPDASGNIEVEGGGSGIDVTAEVGQTIVVKEVDANGKPTKWESADYQPRTHWSDFTKEIQPYVQVTPAYNSTFGVPLHSLSDFKLTEGNKYKVVFDGTEYICETFVASMAGLSGLAIGNAAIVGGANTGEPFGIYRLDKDTTAYCIFFDMNPHTVQIFEENVQKLGDEYYDRALFIDLVEDGTDGDGNTLYTTDITPSVLRDAFDRNVAIFLKVPIHLGGSEVLPLVRAFPTFGEYGDWTFGSINGDDIIQVALTKSEEAESYAVLFIERTINDIIDARLKSYGLID